MIEIKTYTSSEIGSILGTRKNQDIEKKLLRYDIEYTATGWGDNKIFEIINISDPFKVYCIIELKFAAQSDFYRLKYFMYYFFNDGSFQNLPRNAMSELLDEKGSGVSRQTISKWIKKMADLELFWISDTDFTYYSIRKKLRREISRELYCAAWRQYWEVKGSGGSSEEAILAAYAYCGGYPYKVPKIEFGAFDTALLDNLLILLADSFDKDIANIKPD